MAVSPEESPPLAERDGGSSGLAAWVVGIGVVALGAGLIYLMGTSTAPRLSRGDPAPDFDLPLLDGAGRVARGDLVGGVSLINFWATWCKPCEDEMPAMQRLYDELSGEGFELLAISVDERPEDVERFQQKLSLSFPIALDSDQRTARRYQTMGFPESLLVDSDGRIVERYVGPREWDHRDYVARIRRLMSSPAP